MKSLVVGLNFGDEGKGNIVNYLSTKNDYVVRYNGGANAGHTVVMNGNKYKFHIMPSGILAKNSPTAIISHGLVIDPIKLRDEINYASKILGQDTLNLMVDENVHLVMPWHIDEDVKKNSFIGTTKKGIGPAYAAKIARRNSIRLKEFNWFFNSLKDNCIDTDRFDIEVVSGYDLNNYAEAIKSIYAYVCDVGHFLREKVKYSDKNILFESANGIHLDIDFGTYPFVTSSAVGTCAIPQACGLPNLYIDNIYGVIKCYTTRVASGDFPSEIKELEIVHRIRERGNEYGTTTGRPRRIGWLDLNYTIKGIELTGTNKLCLMHADTMFGLEKVYIYYNSSLIGFKGWESKDDPNFKTYCDYIEEKTGVQISIISYGPDMNDKIIKN